MTWKFYTLAPLWTTNFCNHSRTPILLRHWTFSTNMYITLFIMCWDGHMIHPSHQSDTETRLRETQKDNNPYHKSFIAMQKLWNWFWVDWPQWPPTRLFYLPQFFCLERRRFLPDMLLSLAIVFFQLFCMFISSETTMIWVPGFMIDPETKCYFENLSLKKVETSAVKSTLNYFPLSPGICFSEICEDTPSNK